MSRRGRSGPAVSLFAFQDIITSVSGIIIVMVLLLALELSERPNAAAADAAQSRHLREAILNTEATLRQMQSATSETDAVIRAMAAASPLEIQQEIATAIRHLDDLQHEIAAQKGEESRTKRELQAVEVAKFDQQQDQTEREKLQQERGELNRKLQEEREDPRPVYGLPRGRENDQGWLVVLEAGRVSFAPLGKPERPVSYDDIPGLLSGKTAIRQFLEWSQANASRNAYFLLLVRPNGVAAFQKLAEEFHQKQTSFGFDLIAAGQTVLHPERGAGP